MPDGALFSVANAAVYGMVQALQAEFRDRQQRINEVGWFFVVGGWQRRRLAAALVHPPTFLFDSDPLRSCSSSNAP
jgi:hypothetical protein